MTEAAALELLELLIADSEVNEDSDEDEPSDKEETDEVEEPATSAERSAAGCASGAATASCELAAGADPKLKIAPSCCGCGDSSSPTDGAGASTSDESGEVR